MDEYRLVRLGDRVLSVLVESQACAELVELSASAEYSLRPLQCLAGEYARPNRANCRLFGDRIEQDHAGRYRRAGVVLEHEARCRGDQSRVAWRLQGRTRNVHQQGDQRTVARDSEGR